MNSGRAKKILLGLLALVAIYVWWGNLQLLTLSAVSDPVSASLPRPTAAIRSELQYRQPAINPFSLQQVEEINSSDTLEALPPPVAPEPASTVWQLIGVVTTKKRATAVFLDHGGATTICGVGDTLGNWKVQSITEKYAITAQDNWRDTLWLRGIERK